MNHSFTPNCRWEGREGDGERRRVETDGDRWKESQIGKDEEQRQMKRATREKEKERQTGTEGE